MVLGLIEVRDLIKDYPLRHGFFRAVDSVSFQLRRGERMAVMGPNGSGKSTLIRLLGGIELPTSGKVTRSMSISWPLGFFGGVVGGLTGLDNIRFICRIYDAPLKETKEIVEDFSELGDFLLEPVRTYSSGMLAKFAFGLSVAINFDCYLIDEVLAVGDTRFQQKCRDLLFGGHPERSFIIATHIPEIVREFSDRVLLMRHGKGKVFSDLELAIAIYNDFGKQVRTGHKMYMMSTAKRRVPAH